MFEMAADIFIIRQYPIKIIPYAVKLCLLFSDFTSSRFNNRPVHFECIRFSDILSFLVTDNSKIEGNDVRSINVINPAWLQARLKSCLSCLYALQVIEPG